MAGLTREQIIRAKQVDILDYVLSHEPDNVRRVGNEYRLKDRSVTISNGKWNWQSHGFGSATATALNYLISVRNYSFPDAVRHLTGDSAPIRQTVPKAQSPPKPFALPPRNGDNTRILAYLTGRGISEKLLRDCIVRGALYESARYHNCVFVGRDADGKPRYASMRGTTGSFKRDVSGSDKRYGFLLPSQDTACHSVAVFESPIDCLSHQTLCELGAAPPFSGWRLSLGGTALAALWQFLQVHPDVAHCHVCTDSDRAGEMAATKIAELPGIRVTRSMPDGKDWNDDLITIKGVKPMEDKRKDILFLGEPFTYPEAFRVKDGESVKVTFAYDGSVDVQKCRFIDETHLIIGGNTYHISELAEKLNKNGNRVEPIPDQKPLLDILAADYGESLRDVTIPMSDAAVRKLVGGKFAMEPLRNEHALLRGESGVVVCALVDGALAPVHPYWAQTLKRELGTIDPPPGMSARERTLSEKLTDAKNKAAEQKETHGGSPKRQNDRETR